MSKFPLITVMTFAPQVGAAMLLGIGSANKRLARGIALAFSLMGLVFAAILWAHFDGTSGERQFEERHSWIPSIGVQYFVAVDGLGLLMVLLTAIVTPMAILASWDVEEKAPAYF